MNCVYKETCSCCRITFPERMAIINKGSQGYVDNTICPECALELENYFGDEYKEFKADHPNTVNGRTHSDADNDNDKLKRFRAWTESENISWEETINKIAKHYLINGVLRKT